jgi:hypothetical protein
MCGGASPVGRRGAANDKRESKVTPMVTFASQGVCNMKKLLIVAAVLSLCASTAMAVPVDPTTDGIGVYFDQGATMNCSQAAPYTAVTAYLMGTRLSRGGMSGWEATLCVNPTSFGAGITLDIGAGALNVLTAPDFQCGLSPSRSGTEVVLLSISTFYLGGPILFGVGPCVPSSFGGLSPGYTDPLDPAILAPLTPSSNIPWTMPIYLGSNTNLPPTGPPNCFVVAGVNATPCPTANEPATWGGVKDLYK